MNHHLLLILHLIAATVWVGGHLYAAICVLPTVLKNRDPRALLKFEKSFSRAGLPALLLLVITGVWMALQFGVQWQHWFSFSNPVERVVSFKLLLLLFTLLLALSAQTRVIPALKDRPGRLPEMAVHLILVTLAGVAMLVLGSFVRYGGL